MTIPDDMEKALRQLLRAADAYGRPVNIGEMKRFHEAWDFAQGILAKTPAGQEPITK